MDGQEYEKFVLTDNNGEIRWMGIGEGRYRIIKHTSEFI